MGLLEGDDNNTVYIFVFYFGGLAGYIKRVLYYGFFVAFMMPGEQCHSGLLFVICSLNDARLAMVYYGLFVTLIMLEAMSVCSVYTRVS